MDSKIDRRKNAEPYIKGKAPSFRSEYFGKSYGQLKRESRSVGKPKSIDKKEYKGITKALKNAMKD